MSGFYFTPDRSYAEDYANDAAKETGEAFIHEVFLDIKNPKEFGSNDEDLSYNEFAQMTPQMISDLKKEGYDGALFKSRWSRKNSLPSEYLVFDADQIIRSGKGEARKNKSFNVMAVKSSDCGANQEGGGGFVEGNTCATGERAKPKLPAQETTRLQRLTKRSESLQKRIDDADREHLDRLSEIIELRSSRYESDGKTKEYWEEFLKTEAGQEYMVAALEKSGLPREDTEKWLKDNPDKLLTDDPDFMKVVAPRRLGVKKPSNFVKGENKILEGMSEEDYQVYEKFARRHKRLTDDKVYRQEEATSELKSIQSREQGLKNRKAAVDQKIYFEKNPVSEEIGWHDHKHKSVQKIVDDGRVMTKGLEKLSDATPEQIDRAIDQEYKSTSDYHRQREGRGSIVSRFRERYDDDAHVYQGYMIDELKRAPLVGPKLKSDYGIDLDNFDFKDQGLKDKLAGAIDEMGSDPLYAEYIGRAGYAGQFYGGLERARVSGKAARERPYLDIISDHNQDIVRPASAPEKLQLWSKDSGMSGEEKSRAQVDYENTRAFANGLREEVQKDIVKDRGLDQEKMEAIEQEMWGKWKNSSSNSMSTFAKVAAHEEFGTLHRFSEEELYGLIDGAYSPSNVATDPKELLDYLKAHTRATWKTSQYLMKEAGVKDVGLYRGMVLKEGMIDTDGLRVGDEIKDVDIVRSALQSTTTDPNVANGWDGSQGNVMGEIGNKRVVMRFKSEPNDVLSLPVYGDNVHGENEVVLLGTNWENWDARLDNAPTIEEVGIGEGEEKKSKGSLDDFESDLSGIKGFNGSLSTKSKRNGLSDKVGDRPAILIEENWGEWKAEAKDRDEKKKSFSLAKRSFAVVAIKSPKEDPEKSDCGANAEGGGGFQEGNTCATGEKKEAPESWKILAKAGRDYRENGTKSEKFKEWFGDWENDPENASKVVDENGEPSEKLPFSAVTDEDGNPVIVYHGTTHEFNEFNRDKANPENHMGAGFYFSDQSSDSEVNYGAHGADLTNRIEMAAEQLNNWDEFSLLADEAIEDLEGGRETFVSLLKDDMGLDDDDVGEVMEAVEGGDQWEVSKAAARQQIAGDDPKVIKSYLNMRNPVVMGEPQPILDYRGKRGKIGPMQKGETLFELEYEELDYEGRSTDHPDFDYDTAEYTGRVKGNAAEFMNNLKIRAMDSEFYYNSTEEGLADLEQELNEYGSMRAGVLISKAKSKLYDLTDEEGKLISSEIVRQALEDSGFDGIIYQDASKHFPNFGRSGGEPLLEGTKHYVVFDPKNIKAYDNQGTFDPEDANIYKSFKVFPVKSSDCGANAEGGGGFQEGNTCATGESAKDGLSKEARAKVDAHKAKRKAKLKDTLEKYTKQVEELQGNLRRLRLRRKRLTRHGRRPTPN